MRGCPMNPWSVQAMSSAMIRTTLGGRLLSSAAKAGHDEPTSPVRRVAARTQPPVMDITPSEVLPDVPCSSRLRRDDLLAKRLGLGMFGVLLEDRVERG